MYKVVQQFKTPSKIYNPCLRFSSNYLVHDSLGQLLAGDEIEADVDGLLGSLEVPDHPLQGLAPSKDLLVLHSLGLLGGVQVQKRVGKENDLGSKKGTTGAFGSRYSQRRIYSEFIRVTLILISKAIK